jgi:hypothetical protein
MTEVHYFVRPLQGKKRENEEKRKGGKNLKSLKKVKLSL